MIVEQKEGNEQKLKLSRDKSNVKACDFEDVLKVILSFFEQLAQENPYYNQFILFFYKNFVNSPIFLNYILRNYPNIISKIMSISLSNEYQKYNERIIKRQLLLSKLIMLKLFCQIVENIRKEREYFRFQSFFEKENILLLNSNIKINIKEEDSIKNSFVLIIKIMFNNLKIKNEPDIIIKYYNRLLFICLDKIIENKDKNTNSNNNGEDIINKLFNNLSNSILLFLLVLK